MTELRNIDYMSQLSDNQLAKNSDRSISKWSNNIMGN
jgi:hypothetical protein